MTLFEFIEHFNKDTQIVVLYYGNIEYRGTVGGITADNLRNRKVLQGDVVMHDGEICIPVNIIYPKRSADVTIKLRENLSEIDRQFIEQEIEKMMYKKEWKKYIKALGYVSHVEGTHEFEAWE